MKDRPVTKADIDAEALATAMFGRDDPVSERKLPGSHVVDIPTIIKICDDQPQENPVRESVTVDLRRLVCVHPVYVKSEKDASVAFKMDIHGMPERLIVSVYGEVGVPFHTVKNCAVKERARIIYLWSSTP